MESTDHFFTKAELNSILLLDKKADDGNSDNNDVRKTGDLVWIRNQDADETDQLNKQKPFYKVNIVSDMGDKIKGTIAAGEECNEPKLKGTFEMNKKDGDLDLVMDYSDMADKGIKDMIDIDELNHATILYNLYKRYIVGDINTYVGPTLLVINPFGKVPMTPMEKFREITVAENFYDVQKNLPASIYAVSAVAHKQMIENKIRQGIVISGESGAGKTESAKMSMAFLTSLGTKNIDPNKAPMETRILSTNPVLEAFGNSRTARNNNSSRFGKYIKLFFDQEDGKVLGAEIKNYLLEKSRVTGCTDVERNFHVFFFFLRGVSDEYAKKLGFVQKNGKRKDFPDFIYLSKCNDLGHDYDIKEYKELMQAFQSLGFSEEEIDCIHRITAACLHIGQLDLNEKTYDDGKNAKPVSINNQDQLKILAELLGITKPEELELEIVMKGRIEGIGRTPDKPQNVSSSKESLAKALFDNMFNWLVQKMNIEILPEELKSGNATIEQQFNQKTKTIGLLDIFGFENFELNQFEQLCINYVNEKLHNLYISSVFGAERKEMEREGVIVNLIQPQSNVKKILLLLDNNRRIFKTAPLGLFDIVADKSSGGMGGDDKKKMTKTMYDAIIKEHEVKNAKIFLKIRASNKFTIFHSAKNVVYDATNFIERNADSMSSSLSELIMTKSVPMVGKIYSMKTGFEAQVEDDNSKQKRGPSVPKTIWGKFSIQIGELMKELAEPLIEDLNDTSLGYPATIPKSNEPLCEKTDLHFIRCLKPNDKKVPKFFAHSMTLQQITYMGVLESIKVKQVNFPFRRKYEDFYKLFELLSPSYGEGRYDLLTEVQKSSRDWKELSLNIMKRVLAPLDQSVYDSIVDKRFAFGNSKVLMMGEIKNALDKCKSIASLKYDINAKYLKRVYYLQQANDKFSVRMKCLIKIQRFMKKTYQRIQLKRANIMQQKILNAIIAFKTEKRKDFEMEAAEIIEQTYRKYIFRESLNQAIQSRNFMIQGIFDLASINRCRKMWICRKVVMKTFQGAFRRAKTKREQDSVYRIQRILRGHMERNGKEDLVLQAVRAKVELKQHVSAKKIQKRLMGLIVRRRIAFLEEKVCRIQASLKMKWTRRVYFVIRKNVLILQKGYRRYMARRDQIKVRLYQYLAQELQVLENVKAMEFSQLHNSNQNRQQAQQMGLLKSLTPYSIKKIHFFIRVIDLGIQTDLSEIYAHPWSAQWIKAKTESTLNESPIMDVSAGLTHTMIINSKGKVFSWGWNDNGQCAKPSQINEVVLGQQSIKNAQVNFEYTIDKDKQLMIQNQGGITIKQAMAIDDRCLLLIKETNEIVVWGSNDKGQLGVGHYEDVFQPQKIDFFSKNNVKIQHIAAGGNLNLASSESGEAYAWPFIHNGIKQCLPTKMPFSEKTSIQKVACGHNFGFFISNQGLVYAFGEDNSDGQLGLGHNYPTEFPELIQCLRDIGERIDSVDCGFKHVIAKSSLGKIYTWGSSNKGQLGHDHFDSELSPRPLYIDKKNNKKVAQIAAGFSHSMVMMETNKEIYWFGTSGSLQEQAFPIQFDLQRHLPDLFGNPNQQESEENASYVLGSNQQDFSIVKINCSWSKTMSISNMLIADLRAVNQSVGYTKLISTLQNLGNKWEHKDIMPPYIEVISGLFPANIMKKPTILKTTKSAQSNKQKGTMSASGALPAVQMNQNNGMSYQVGGRNQNVNTQAAPPLSARGTKAKK